MAEPTGQFWCGMAVQDDWDCFLYQIADENFTACYPPGTGGQLIFPVCCNFPPVNYQDDGAGGLHCYGQPAAGSCLIPAGTWTVAAGGDTSPYPGTMLVAFSDGQQLFEDGNIYNCGDFSEVVPPILNSGTFTFAAPVVATLFFEHDNGQGVPHPTVNSFICFQPA